MRKFLIIILSLYICSNANSQNTNNENIVKAAFLEKFALFTEWPEDVKMDNFYITVIGETKMQEGLKKIVSLKIKDKKIIIKYISDIKDLGNCHILYIENSEKNNLNKILSVVANRPILTVSASTGFSEKGVHFNFFITENQNLHFVVNIEALAKTKLKVDVMLLNYAKKIK